MSIFRHYEKEPWRSRGGCGIPTESKCAVDAVGTGYLVVEAVQTSFSGT